VVLVCQRLRLTGHGIVPSRSVHHFQCDESGEKAACRNTYDSQHDRIHVTDGVQLDQLRLRAECDIRLSSFCLGQQMTAHRSQYSPERESMPRVLNGKARLTSKDMRMHESKTTLMWTTGSLLRWMFAPVLFPHKHSMFRLGVLVYPHHRGALPLCVYVTLC
jgi:hypothetical protein